MESNEQTDSPIVATTQPSNQTTNSQTIVSSGAATSTQLTQVIENLKQTFENEKSQEELTNMLRLLIANFCDQHFVKHLQKAKTQIKTLSPSSNELPKCDQSNKTDESIKESLTQPTETKKILITEKTGETTENSSKEIEQDLGSNKSGEQTTKSESTKQTKNYYDEIDNTNLTLSPPSSSISNYSQTKNSDSVTNNDKNSNLVSPPPSSSSSASSDIHIDTNSQEKTNEQQTSIDEDLTKHDNSNDSLKTLKEMSSSDERVNHMHLKDQQIDDEYLMPSSKLWSTILIGSDKLEIFGSIHVRSNNIRLLSCLIDEQISIDNPDGNISLSSASSSISSSVPLPTRFLINKTIGVQKPTQTSSYLIKPGYIYSDRQQKRLDNYNYHHNHHHHHHRSNRRNRHRRGHNGHKYQHSSSSKRNDMNSKKRRNLNNLYENVTTSLNHVDEEIDQNYDDENENINELINEDNLVIDSNDAASNLKQQNENEKLKVVKDSKNDDDNKSAKNELINYPIKKFKAYHHYCNSKRKQEELESQAKTDSTLTNQTCENDKEQTDMSTNSLNNLASVAAAALKLSTQSQQQQQQQKHSRKSRKTSNVIQIHDLNNESELEYNDDDVEDIINDDLADANASNNPNQYIYDDDQVQEDNQNFDDDHSSVISAGSSYSSDHSSIMYRNGASRRHRRHRRRSHSRCSSMTSEPHLSSSRSILSSRSPSHNKQNMRRLSPSSSIVSSTYSNDYEDAYRSYSSSSSYRSDYENYDYENDEINSYANNKYLNGNKRHRRHVKSSKKLHNHSKMDKNETKSHKKRTNDDLLIKDASLLNEAHPCDKEIKCEKETNLLMNQKPVDLDTSMQQNDVEQEQQDRRREEDYLMRKYKRRFAPYNGSAQSNQTNSNSINNGTNGTNNSNSNQLNEIESNSNLYLLAASRQHRMYTGLAAVQNNANNNEMNEKNIPSNELNTTNSTNSSSLHHHFSHLTNNQNNQEHLSHKKMISVNSLVDRLSPISDPDLENQQKLMAQENLVTKLNAHNKSLTNESVLSKLHQSNVDQNEINILNRINNLSPSSSSSSSSSIKNPNGNLSQNGQLNPFHTSQPSAAVLAAAAAAAAAVDLRNMAPHHHHQLAHQVTSQSLHNHAQSVAALLADMQQQQQQQQVQSQADVAKAIAASLSNVHGNHHHHPHLNPHHQHSHTAQTLLSRFSNNHSQNDLMAAVLAQQQQQQQQQQHHRSLLDSHTHLNGSHHHLANGNNYSSAGALNSNGQLYSRYSNLNAAVAAAAAAAAAANSHRRANSVESDATPSPPSTTPAGHGNSSSNNGQSNSISSAASSTSSTSDNYSSSKENKSSKEKLMNDSNNSSNGNEKVRLVQGYDVFISTNDLNACNDDRGSATRLLRNLMDVFFDKSTLAKSSINGTGRITNTLDKHVISALFAYVKNRYVDVPHSQLTRAATDKCVQTRRNFRKKIKAAQSYFGMFPSLMMARPPQMPQGSENQV